MLARNEERWHIVLLTCRDPATDFRLPLAEELQSLGHEVFYICLKRRPIVTDISGAEAPREFSLFDFLKYMRRTFRTKRPLLFFNSTNLVFPVFSGILRALCGGLWFFDMHDDLLYGKKGLARLRAKMAQHLLISMSDQIVHAAPTLKELFPSSIHLGNASTMTAIERLHPDFSKVLILASIDERLDFEFLVRAARLNPDLSFEIYGHISGNEAGIGSRVEAAVKSVANIHYKGPYINSELPRILSEYAATLAPYVVGSPLTRYIDPLRYYHCLNSGMEVISTAIPKARDFGEVLHIVHDPAEVGAVIARVATDHADPRNRRSTAVEHNWRNKAITLMDIVLNRSGTAGAA